jgi:hypothetical protein
MRRSQPDTETRGTQDGFPYRGHGSEANGSRPPRRTDGLGPGMGGTTDPIDALPDRSYTIHTSCLRPGGHRSDR